MNAKDIEWYKTYPLQNIDPRDREVSLFRAYASYRNLKGYFLNGSISTKLWPSGRVMAIVRETVYKPETGEKQTWSVSQEIEDPQDAVTWIEDQIVARATLILEVNQ